MKRERLRRKAAALAAQVVAAQAAAAAQATATAASKPAQQPQKAPEIGPKKPEVTAAPAVAKPKEVPQTWSQPKDWAEKPDNSWMSTGKPAGGGEKAEEVLPMLSTASERRPSPERAPVGEKEDLVVAEEKTPKKPEAEPLPPVKRVSLVDASDSSDEEADLRRPLITTPATTEDLKAILANFTGTPRPASSAEKQPPVPASPVRAEEPKSQPQAPLPKKPLLRTPIETQPREPLLSCANPPPPPRTPEGDLFERRRPMDVDERSKGTMDIDARVLRPQLANQFLLQQGDKDERQTLIPDPNAFVHVQNPLAQSIRPVAPLLGTFPVNPVVQNPLVQNMGGGFDGPRYQAPGGRMWGAQVPMQPRPQAPVQPRQDQWPSLEKMKQMSQHVKQLVLPVVTEQSNKSKHESDAWEVDSQDELEYEQTLAAFQNSPWWISHHRDNVDHKSISEPEPELELEANVAICDDDIEQLLSARMKGRTNNEVQ